MRDGYKSNVIQPLNAIYSQVAASKPTLAGTIDAWTAFGGAAFDQSLHKDDQHLNEAGAALMTNLVVHAVG